ncbi:MAG TPA: acetyl-CoA carboxylase biotin carboxylase subunit, partial [Methanoregulaceae archaeon]|nr:acetyl-CoA carboxylase biotin carboxylase subunit [Methanoregulaceae archaeon]
THRAETIARMRRAIYEYVIIGVKTTLPLHHAIMHNQHFMDGDTHTHFLQEEHILKTLPRYVREEEKRMQTLAAPLRQGQEIAAITGAVNVYLQSKQKSG